MCSWHCGRRSITHRYCATKCPYEQECSLWTFECFTHTHYNGPCDDDIGGQVNVLSLKTQPVSQDHCEKSPGVNPSTTWFSLSGPGAGAAGTHSGQTSSLSRGPESAVSCMLASGQSQDSRCCFSWYLCQISLNNRSVSSALLNLEAGQHNSSGGWITLCCGGDNARASV